MGSSARRWRRKRSWKRLLTADRRMTLHGGARSHLATSAWRTSFLRSSSPTAKACFACAKERPTQKANGCDRQSSALSRSLCDKRRGYVLNLFTSTLGAARMSGFMLCEMFNVLKRFVALLAAVLVSRHGIPPARIVRVPPRTKPGRVQHPVEAL
ncbi:hypothetical protein BN2475_310104 [Paraburkholderia ribeironis]|uniref:Uncharacterized protein n=1 Tax=Paraburkholderia ribeironis TaxID=1247936 RepID=A0A1N7S2I2_9BURK|nr:hypothetical protein BN2475_310104 [Paraburkholderia ribeironis]